MRAVTLVFAVLAAATFFVVYGAIADYFEGASTQISTTLEARP